MSQASPTKKILVVHYSQTGQLDNTVFTVAAPLEQSPDCEVTYLNLKPASPYPFPWPITTFINAFPEAVYEKGCELEKIPESLIQQYDLIILGYQVWYLSPSHPVAAFLQSKEAEALFPNTPVVTVIACRNMWLMAQERVKKHLLRLGGKLVGNVALVDKAGSGLSFFATPLWVLSGNKGPFPLGIPEAGVDPVEIQRSDRFGQAILERFQNDQELSEDLFKGLGAVKINCKLVATEKIATRSFLIWGKLFLLLGKPDGFPRRILAVVYAAFLILLILTVVPVNVIIKKLLSPLTRKHDQSVRAYYSAPSGE